MILDCIDNVDDQREIRRLLSHLHPDKRVEVLRRFCNQCTLLDNTHPRPQKGMRERVAEARRCDRADRRLVEEIYQDLLLLINQFNLDPLKMTRELEQVVRANR